MKRFAFALAIAAVTLFAQPAHAASHSYKTKEAYKDRPTEIVRVAELDLTDPSGQEEMRARVDHAARRLCREELTRVARRRCAARSIDYTMSLVSANMRGAYAAAVERRRGLPGAQTELRAPKAISAGKAWKPADKRPAETA